MFRDFADEYDGYVEYLKQIQRKSNELDGIQHIFDNSNDFELVKENLVRNTEEMFKEYN